MPRAAGALIAFVIAAALLSVRYCKTSNEEHFVCYGRAAPPARQHHRCLGSTKSADRLCGSFAPSLYVSLSACVPVWACSSVSLSCTRAWSFILHDAWQPAGMPAGSGHANSLRVVFQSLRHTRTRARTHTHYGTRARTRTRAHTHITVHARAHTERERKLTVGSLSAAGLRRNSPTSNGPTGALVAAR